eukprot:TRINITY_DN1586_c0_g1_i3.p4 TRINITY_DN1586_c0_g1~~TRINITY_DN1586_c0_g1_i3.p4  ORF type:complete len:101 (+),score=16.27 TRINITY_DN1586_c0_g1_i3:104-406(+)
MCEYPIEEKPKGRGNTREAMQAQHESELDLLRAQALGDFFYTPPPTTNAITNMQNNLSSLGMGGGMGSTGVKCPQCNCKNSSGTERKGKGEREREWQFLL